VRVLVSLLFVAAISYGMEASRSRYGKLTQQYYGKLLDERENVERARKDVATLGGLIPICSCCKSIRDDEGYWQQVESYVRSHSGAEFSHGICPDCYAKLEADL